MAAIIIVSLIVIVLVLIILGVFLAKSYNSFIVLKNRVKDQEAQINVQLKRRYDLIPNLVETAKGYAAFEKSTLDAVVSARAKATATTNFSDSMEANNELSRSIGKLFAISESYPDLKASQNFLQLQEEFSDTENKIAKARQFFNDTVLKYNNAIQVFPANIAAAILGHKPMSYLAVDEVEKDGIKLGADTFKF